MNDFYMIVWSGGCYEDFFSYEKVYIGKDNAEAFFNELKELHTEYNSRGTYSYGADEMAMYKANVCDDGGIVADHNQTIHDIEWDGEKWVEDNGN